MRFPKPRRFDGVFAVCLLGVFFTPAGAEAGAPRSAMKKASESIRNQEPPKVSPRVLERLTPENTQVLISLGKQRAYLMLNGEIAIDTPVSTGKAAGMTPTGKFQVQEKDANHHSNVYGNFVDPQGRVIRGGVSTRIDSAPSGTHFDGAPMKWFMRISEGVGMHVGLLPGYPASHGCVRMPPEIAAMFYKKVKIGTPVEVAQ